MLPSEVTGVGEYQAPVVEVDRPAPAGFGDADIADRDGIPGCITEVFDDDPEPFVAAAFCDISSSDVHQHVTASMPISSSAARRWVP